MTVKDIKPLADRILAIPEERSTRTTSGILIPPSAAEQTQLAKVVAIGNEVKEVKVGQIVLFSESDFKALDKIKYAGNEIVLIKEAAVIAVVEVTN